jgi:hypothetical protein
MVTVKPSYPDVPSSNYNVMGLVSLYLDDQSWADLTGHFALEVALWMGFNPIYLLGYDLYGGHFCDDFSPEAGWQDVQLEAFEITAKQLKEERPKVNIYNLSPDSLIEGFEKRGLDEI